MTRRRLALATAALGAAAAAVAYRQNPTDFDALLDAARPAAERAWAGVAATRVTVVPAPAPTPAPDESPVLARAKARAARTQLVADQIVLENRTRQMPEAVKKAEQEACYTEQGATDAARTLAARKAAHEQAVAKLAVLRKEKAAADAELAAIRAELRKLADVV
ncbi:hypothetical protein J0H58_28030 [bacterium]|nr:hypothetical protein [bacterium]